jgi:hypothetical protein
MMDIDLRGTRWQEGYEKEDLASEIVRLRAENKAAWDSAEYNARRAEKAEQRIAELEKALIRFSKNPDLQPFIGAELAALRREG